MVRQLLLVALLSCGAAFTVEPVITVRHAKARVPMISMGGPNAKDGLFTPLVQATKQAIGEKEFFKVRGKVITLHSDVIKAFVDTSDSKFGQITLNKMFEVADQDGSGCLCEDELKEALEALGFELTEKQLKGIFDRADKDGGGSIDLEEFVQAAPKTLKTNLVKLAKNNGNELGFLS